MKTLSATALVTALVALALPWSGPVGANSGLRRCEQADGSIAYTDRVCASLGARQMVLSGELLTRIARDEAAYGQGIDFSDAQPVANVGRRSQTSGCARSTRQLSMDIQGSLALHSVNRLAESYHWVGRTHREAQQHMLRLERMAAQRLTDAKYFDAQIGGAMQFADASMASPNTGIVQLTLDNGSAQQVMDLTVLRYSGCYFVRL